MDPRRCGRARLSSAFGPMLRHPQPGLKVPAPGDAIQSRFLRSGGQEEPDGVAQRRGGSRTVEGRAGKNLMQAIEGPWSSCARVIRAGVEGGVQNMNWGDHGGSLGLASPCMADVPGQDCMAGLRIRTTPASTVCRAQPDSWGWATTQQVSGGVGGSLHSRGGDIKGPLS